MIQGLAAQVHFEGSTGGGGVAARFKRMCDERHGKIGVVRQTVEGSVMVQLI